MDDGIRDCKKQGVKRPKNVLNNELIDFAIPSENTAALIFNGTVEVCQRTVSLQVESILQD